MGKLSASLEDYLEVIGRLEATDRVARARDIATSMNVNRSSVTRALKELSAKGLVNWDPYSFVTLTDRGKHQSREIARRHEILTRFLNEMLSIDLKTAVICK